MTGKRFGLAVLLTAFVACTGEDKPATTINESETRSLDTQVKYPTKTEDNAPNGKSEKVVASVRYTDEPLPKANGKRKGVDISENRIFKWSQFGNLSTFLKKASDKNKYFFDPEGNPLERSDNDRRLLSINFLDRKVTVLDSIYDYEHQIAPNDIWIDSKGGIYFIHSDIEIPDNVKTDEKYVYYLTPDRKNFIRIIDDLKSPETITGASNGTKLYVIQSNETKIYTYTIKADGTLTDKSPYKVEPCEQC